MTQINIMALRHSAFYSPLLMTVAGGFLKEEGLEPVYTLPTPAQTIPDSLADGRCHVAQSAVATGFAYLEKGEESPFVHFAQINARDGFFIAGRQPEPAFRWQSLVGKEVLVDHFFQPLAMLKYGLHRQGVEFSSLEVIDAGDVNAIDRAFREGRADYVHQQGPAPQQLAHDGIAHVIAAVGEAVGPVAFSSLCARRDWLATDMAKSFMRAYRKALAYVIQSPAGEIAAYESEAGFFPGTEQQVLAETIARYQQLGNWQVDPIISRSSYENLLDVFVFNELISKRHPYESLVAAPPN